MCYLISRSSAIHWRSNWTINPSWLKLAGWLAGCLVGNTTMLTSSRAIIPKHQLNFFYSLLSLALPAVSVDFVVYTRDSSCVVQRCADIAHIVCSHDQNQDHAGISCFVWLYCPLLCMVTAIWIIRRDHFRRGALFTKWRSRRCGRIDYREDDSLYSCTLRHLRYIYS